MQLHPLQPNKGIDMIIEIEAQLVREIEEIYLSSKANMNAQEIQDYLLGPIDGLNKNLGFVRGCIRAINALSEFRTNND